MPTAPTVSAIVIFLNEERFLCEAIQSVLAQTTDDWELLLVDDGSTDASSAIARSFAARFPDQIRYLEHPQHANLGMSASRNLGIECALGRFVALLDADDVWLPHKLESQKELLDARPEAGMVYGRSRYWFSWSGRPEDIKRDFIPMTGVPSGTLVQPPSLLPTFLSGKAVVPCPSSLLIRRDLLLQVGGFEAQFTGMYEDQAFFAKFVLFHPVCVVDTCWSFYRQHATATTALARKANTEIEARRAFLTWLKSYLVEQRVKDETLWRVLQEESWLLEIPHGVPVGLQRYVRWVRKWLLRSGLCPKANEPGRG